MANNIDIALACDERYFPGLLATISSILVSSDRMHSYRFHVLDGGLKTESINFLKNSLSKFRNDNELNLLKVDTSLFNGFPDFFFDSPMNYARLLLPNLLKDLERVIYVDVDILYLKDIKQLWNTDLENNSTAAGLELSIKNLGNEFFDCDKFNLSKETPYFNNGLMVMDLNEWRSKNISEKIMDIISRHPDQCKFHEQSAMNINLSRDFKLLDKSWNIQSHREAFDPINDFEELQALDINYHFVTSSKPWLKYNNNPANRLFYTLLDELDYRLSDDAFLSSKISYQREMKIAQLLPLFFQLRGMLRKSLGKKNKTASDQKTSEYWKKQVPVIKFWNQKEGDINEMIVAWRKKIQQSMVG